VPLQQKLPLLKQIVSALLCLLTHIVEEAASVWYDVRYMIIVIVGSGSDAPASYSEKRSSP
jgi:hypothetical protein